MISAICEDKTVTVEGVRMDVPTGNEVVSASAIEVCVEGHVLCITAASPVGIRLFNSFGRLMSNRLLSAGVTRIEGLPAGVYFLSVAGEPTRKVWVGR